MCETEEYSVTVNCSCYIEVGGQAGRVVFFVYITNGSKQYYYPIVIDMLFGLYAIKCQNVCTQRNHYITLCIEIAVGLVGLRLKNNRRMCFNATLTREFPWLVGLYVGVLGENVQDSLPPKIIVPLVQSENQQQQKTIKQM